MMAVPFMGVYNTRTLVAADVAREFYCDTCGPTVTDAAILCI